MAPYLHGPDSELKNTLKTISRISQFENIPKTFYFIDGNRSNTKKIGNDISDVEKALTSNNFNCPTSDLNSMIEQALLKVPHETSILVTDALYDLGRLPGDEKCLINKPCIRLQGLTDDLNNIINKKLRSSNFQTIILKAESSFKGPYYFATKPGKCSVNLNQNRPYYYFIFGSEGLLENTELKHKIENISNVNEVIKLNKNDKGNNIRYEIAGYSRINKTRGTYRKCRGDDHCIEDVKISDSKGFDFSVKVDFSDFDWMENLITSPSSYKFNNDLYQLKDDDSVPFDVISEVEDTEYTHQITVSTDTWNVYDNSLKIYIPKCTLPSWVQSSGCKEGGKCSDQDIQRKCCHNSCYYDEISIKGDQERTWGINSIINAISKSYCDHNDHLFELNFEIKR